MTHANPCSLCILTPEKLLAEGLVCLAQQSRFNIASVGAHPGDCIRVVESQLVDVALIDLDVPEVLTSGFLQQLRQRNPKIRIVGISQKRDKKSVIEALKAGVDAYVARNTPWREVVEAIAHVLQGDIFLASQLEIQHWSPEAELHQLQDPLESLSTREYQVFYMLVSGYRPKDIAAQLNLSPKTVDTYRASLMRKLGIYDLPGLVRFALQKNIIRL